MKRQRRAARLRRSGALARCFFDGLRQPLALRIGGSRQLDLGVDPPFASTRIVLSISSCPRVRPISGIDDVLKDFRNVGLSELCVCHGFFSEFAGYGRSAHCLRQRSAISCPGIDFAKNAIAPKSRTGHSRPAVPSEPITIIGSVPSSPSRRARNRRHSDGLKANSNRMTPRATSGACARRHRTANGTRQRGHLRS